MPNDWKTFNVEELIDNKILYKPLDGNHVHLYVKLTNVKSMLNL